jgi:hypothetical protein
MNTSTTINVPLNLQERNVINNALRDAAKKSDRIARQQRKIIGGPSDTEDRYTAHAVECRRLAHHLYFPGTVDK